MPSSPATAVGSGTGGTESHDNGKAETDRGGTPSRPPRVGAHGVAESGIRGRDARRTGERAAEAPAGEQGEVMEAADTIPTWVVVALGAWAGLATIIAAIVSRRPRTTVLKVGTKDGRFGGFPVSVSHIEDSSMTLARDGADAVRVRIVDGMAVIEWDDGKFTDVMEMTRNQLWRHGPSGAISVR